jgi:hypothetical protein
MKTRQTESYPPKYDALFKLVETNDEVVKSIAETARESSAIKELRKLTDPDEASHYQSGLAANLGVTPKFEVRFQTLKYKVRA